MKDTMVAYWHKDGLEVYGIADKKPVKYTSGALDNLEPIKSGLGKKILIVSRDLLLHVRKRYPPAPEEKLRKAVALELGEMFPLIKPAFHCRVFQSFTTYSLVDIWAWENDLYPRIKEVFWFNYVVPEVLLFTSAVPEVKVFQYGGMTSMLAHADGKYLAGASCPDSSFHQGELERFLHSLEQFGTEIKKIKIYGDLPLTLKDIPEISRVGTMDYPPCLDDIEVLDLARFRIRRDYPLWEKRGLVFRVAIYLLLGYTLMLYMTLRNYDRATDEVRQKLTAMDRQTVSLAAGQKSEDYSAVIREVNEKLNATPSPLRVMKMLAQRVPEGSSINRMVLNENILEVAISSKDPVSIVKALGDAKEIKKVSLKGAPLKDRAANIFNFVITMELLQ